MRCGRAINVLHGSLLAGQHMLTGAVAWLQTTANRPLCKGGRGGRSGRRRSCDRNDRGVGLSPGARNTIRDSRLDVTSCRRHGSRNTHWRLDRARRRAHLHHRRVTSAKSAALRPECLLRDSTTKRSSRSVGAERGAPPLLPLRCEPLSGDVGLQRRGGTRRLKKKALLGH